VNDIVVKVLINAILDWLADTVVGALDALWELLSATLFVSPDVTALPQVTAFASTSLNVVNVCYVLAVLWTAILVMGRDTIQSQVGPGELIPRLVIGLIATNCAVPLCSTLIRLANAVTEALTSQDITAPGSMQQLRNATLSALTGQSGGNPIGFLLVVIGLLIAVLTGTLIVQWIIRLGVLVVAVGVSPIALALHGTPHTEGAAKLWWRIMFGTLGTVVIQAVALHTTLRLFLDPATGLHVLGLPMLGGEPAATMNLFVVVCLLWGVVKIPGLMSRYVTQSRPNPMGTVLRVVVVQQLTRGLSKVLGSRHGRLLAGRGTARGANGGGGTVRPWPVTAARTDSRSISSSAARSAPRPRVGLGLRGAAVAAGRPVRPYSREELAEGVDLYTRTVPKRPAPTVPRSLRPPIRAAGVIPEPPRSGPRLPVPPGVTPATAMPGTRPVRPPVRGWWNQPGGKP